MAHPKPYPQASREFQEMEPEEQITVLKRIRSGYSHGRPRDAITEQIAEIEKGIKK